MRCTKTINELVPASTVAVSYRLRCEKTCHIRELRLHEGEGLAVTKVGWGKEKGESFKPVVPLRLGTAIKLAQTFVVGKVVRGGSEVVLVCVNDAVGVVHLHLDVIVEEM
jgi:hypothetical protein